MDEADSLIARVDGRQTNDVLVSGQPYLSSLEGGKFGSSLTHALRLLRFLGCEVIVRPREPSG